QPGKTDKKSAFAAPIGSATRKMTMQDVMALEKRSFNLEAISGVVLGTAQARHEEALSNINVFGVNDQFQRILNIVVQEGSFFSREEDEAGRRVIVLGYNVRESLFGDDSPIGKTVKLNESEFRVIGLVAAMGNKLGFNLDDVAFIPTTAALRLFNEDKLFGIRAKGSSKVGINDAVEEISTILRERRNGEEDFTIITQVAMMDSMSTILNMLSYVLGGIAAISMLVGGIGIMNIMLVTVSERTQEIGIRRAVGARKRDILKQFLVEAVVLSLIGGSIGISIALFLTYGAHYFYPAFDMRPPYWILGPAFFLSVFIGVVFGVWPARKAANIETLDALRYE
ncbi:MAG: ABC transporter permease, partial [Deltaproteobacteria bacterium]|nr:ABC transporter permease [Deltaproteobacteria bacterium]